jgi:hypothetical protein
MVSLPNYLLQGASSKKAKAAVDTTESEVVYSSDRAESGLTTYQDPKLKAS